MNLARIVLSVPLLCACASHAVRNEPTIRELRFHGVRQLDESDLREHLATRETPIFPGQRGILRWWRWWWRDPEYFDDASLLRDRLRIANYYNAHGYFDAEVVAAEVRTLDPNTRDVDITVREGAPSHLADLRLRGCVRDGGALPDALCDRLAERFSLSVGDVPNDAAVQSDRAAMIDMLKREGYPSPRVVPRTMVDPRERRAWVEFTVLPGPVGRFGALRLHVLPEAQEVTGETLPNGLPTRVIRDAIGITPGAPYAYASLIRAQENLFNLGVFGVARIEEHPLPSGVVDLDVQLSAARLWRLRLGGGFEIDPSRNNVHLAAGYEFRNLFGGMRRLRVELRPQLSAPSLFLPKEEQGGAVVPGITGSIELRQPEMVAHTTGIASVSGEYGADPINPSIARRETVRVNLGVERRFNRRVTASVWARLAQVNYFPNDASAREALSDVTLAGQQYLDQTWLYLEQSVVWDDRNDRTHTTRGTYASATLAESLRGPLSDYSFVRASVDGRAYVPLSRSFTFAVRGAFGLAVGETDNAAGWPVPQDLRFYSGGALSNRGYPFNRVGTLGVGSDGNGNERVVAVGGTALWEFSAELRWMPGALGLVAFFDASQVAGIDPSPYLNPQGVNFLCERSAQNPVRDSVCPLPPSAATVPRPQSTASVLGNLFENAHPSVGMGARWLSPVGMVRIDVGFRLNPGGCGTARDQTARQNAAVGSGVAASYVLTEPQCGTLPIFDVTTLSTLHLSLGEAF